MKETIWTCTPTSSSVKNAASDHSATRPIHRLPIKLKVLKYLSLPFTLFKPYGAVFIMNSKIHLRENSSNEYFKTILHYFRVWFTLRLYVGRSINGLVFFFSAGLAEVQVTVLSVLNRRRQGFPATCPIGHCCVCSPLLFASEILCDSPTFNKQRTWAQVAGRVAWKPKMHDDVMLNGVFRICLWLVARQLRIPNR